MAAYKIKKSAWLRRRFIQSEALSNMEGWFDVSQKLKEQIKTDSTFQIVGDKMLVSFNYKTQLGHVLVEVLGIPKNDYRILDLEPAELLIYEFPEPSFQLDFDTLKSRAADLMSVIKHPLSDSYHIVFDGVNLALHFFIQKDYIESKC